MKYDSLRNHFPVRRGLSAPEAAIYIGIGETTFRTMVLEGRMPRPRMINACRVWDVDALDAAFRSLPVEGEKEEVDTWADMAC